MEGPLHCTRVCVCVCVTAFMCFPVSAFREFETCSLIGGLTAPLINHRLSFQVLQVIRVKVSALRSG